MKQTIKLNAIEKWTIVNNNIFWTRVSHARYSVQDHLTQFGRRRRIRVRVQECVLTPLGETVTVIAKFDDFASATDAFMFHCHFSNLEDEGMMGQFLVVL